MPEVTNIIKDEAGYDNLTKWDGFYDNRYYDPLVSGYGFIFVTKPDLFILPDIVYGGKKTDELAHKNMTRDTYFSKFTLNNAMNASDKLLPKLLSFHRYNGVTNFLPMFTNKLKNIETGDITVESVDVFDTKQGYRMPLPTHSSASEAASQLSLSVTESSNMDFTKLLSLWVKYINNVSDGTFDPNPDCVRDGVIDYMCSIYYISLAPDGRTIKYWCKYTGCWPTTIPYSAMRYNRGDPQLVDIDIPFVYTHKEDMTPDILQDFNIVSLGIENSDLVKDGDIDNYLTMEKLKDYEDAVNSSNRPPIILKEEIVGGNIYTLNFNSDTNTSRFLRDIMKDKDNTVDTDTYYFSIDADDGFFKL